MTPVPALKESCDLCRSYLDSVLDREKRATFLALQNVNWHDKPSQFKLYEDVRRIPLPDFNGEAMGSVADVLHSGRRERPPCVPLTLERIADLLFLANGVARRKIEITWNRNHLSQASLEQQFSRPSASGGGLYPVEYYLICGAGQVLPPGVYHYNNAHHALDVLLQGEVMETVREAVRGWDGETSQVFLALSVDFWKNCFKYGAFGYHVVTQDVGAGLAIVRQATDALGLLATPALWFGDRQINNVLGLNGEDESVMALVGLNGAVPSGRKSPRGAGLSSSGTTARRSWQRSAQVTIPELLKRVHAATFADQDSRPTVQLMPGRTAFASGTDYLLGASAQPAANLQETLLTRCSSWGGFRSSPSMTRGQLAFLLRSIDTARHAESDVQQAAGLTRTMLFVNHVEDLPRGVYIHDSQSETIRLVRERADARDLQEHYFLSNYNFEQAGVVFVITADADAVFDEFGSRGLRILNAEVGMTAQYAYTAASALGLGGGALLGFDNLAINDLLGLSDARETSLLLFLAGSQAEPATAFDFRISQV